MEVITEIQVYGDKKDGEWLVIKSGPEMTKIEVRRSWIGDRGGDVKNHLQWSTEVPTKALKKALKPAAKKPPAKKKKKKPAPRMA